MQILFEEVGMHLADPALHALRRRLGFFRQPIARPVSFADGWSSRCPSARQQMTGIRRVSFWSSTNE
jgi:hypothetical protein